MSTHTLAILADNPMAYYRLNETSGNIANDSSPNNYDATVSGTYTWGSPGLIASESDTCLFLDGTTGVLTLPAALSLSIGTWSSISVEFWTNAEGSNLCVTIVYTAGTTTIYFNGTQTMTVASAAIEVSTIFDYIGSYVSSSLDDVGIYNYALSTTQIATHFSTSLAGTETPGIVYTPQTVPQSSFEATLALAPLGYYRLDELVGPTIYDFSGHAFHGIANTSGLTYAQAGALTGELDTAILFDGTQGFLTLPTAINTTGLSHFTISCWINLSSTTFSTNPRIMANAHTDSDGTGFQFAINAHGTGGFMGMGLQNGSQITVNFLQILFVSQVWYHLVCVYDATSAMLLSAYINGQFNASVAASSTIKSATHPIAIGYNPAYSGDYFPGVIDEVSLFQTALTASQIATLYSSASVPPTIRQIAHPYQINYQTIDPPAFATTPPSSSIVVPAGSRFTLTFINPSVATKALLQTANPVMTFALASGEMITGPVQIQLLMQGSSWYASIMTTADCTVNRWIISARFP